MDYAIQAMVLLAVAGHMLAFRQHHQRGPLIVAIIAAAAIFFAYYGCYNVAFVYSGLLALSVAAVWNVIVKRRCATCCAVKNL